MNYVEKVDLFFEEAELSPFQRFALKVTGYVHRIKQWFVEDVLHCAYIESRGVPDKRHPLLMIAEVEKGRDLTKEELADVAREIDEWDKEWSEAK